MTRTRNSSFGGMAPPDADVDVPTFRARLLGLVQDVHFVIDKMTGANGIASTAVCNHNGELGRGAPLRRVPIAQPLMTQNERAGGVGAGGLPVLRMDEVDVGTYGGACIILAVPFMVAQGEDLFRLTVEAHAREDDMLCEVYDSSFNLYNSAPMYLPTDGPDRFIAVLQFPAPGDYYLLVRSAVGTVGGRLRGWQCFPPQNRDAAGASVVNDGVSYFPVGDAVSELPETIHDEMIVDDYPIAGWLVTTLNRTINWLLEAARGAPVQGNGTLTLADSGATDPATSAFWAHTQAGTTFTAEAEVEYVLFTEALGAVRAGALDGSAAAEVVDSGMTAGLLDWAPIFPTYGGTTRRTAHRRVCYVPDFPSGSLKARILAVNSNGKGTPTAWNGRVTTGAGSAAQVSFVQLGSSDFYVSDVVNVPFTPDDVNTFDMELQRSAGATVHGEIMIVGWQLVFDP